MRTILTILILTVTIHANQCEDHIKLIKQNRDMIKLYSKKNTAIEIIEPYAKKYAKYSYEATMYCKGDDLVKSEFDRKRALRILKILREHKAKGYDRIN